MVEAPLAPALTAQSGCVLDRSQLSHSQDTQPQAVWMQCWLAAYAPEGGVCIENVRLVRRRHGPAVISQSVLHSATNLQTPRHSAHLPPLVSSADMRLALKRHRAAGIIFEYLPQSNLEALRDTRQITDLRHLAMPHAAIPVTDCSIAFDQFVEQRSKRERQRTRRLLRLADEADGPLRFSLVSGGDQVKTLVEQCLALEQASWKGREGTAILDRSDDARFYRQLAQDLAAAGLLRLALLHDRQGQLVAFEFCMLWDSRLIALKTSCSEQHLDLSPGHVLALLHIRHCCADDTVSLYDVTGNGLSPAPHLLRYADRQELLWRVILFAPGWRGRLLQLMWQARLRLRSVKRFVARQCA